MQVLKDEVRENIRQAAIRCFMTTEYNKASMREIAKDAGISVGNLYRYFSNKEAIFDFILEELLGVMRENEKMDTKEKKGSMPFIDINFLEEYDVLEKLITARVSYREELYILLLCSAGSKYENIRQSIADYMENHVLDLYKMHVDDEHRIGDDRIYVKATIRGVIESFCVILEETKDDQEFVKALIQIIELNFKAIARNIKGIQEKTIKFRRFTDEEINYFINCHSTVGGNNRSESH